MNNIFWKCIKNKGEVTLDSFRNLAYLSSYLAFKEFRMEARLRNILRATNVAEFIKAILESSCKVLLGPYILAVSKHLVFF